MERIGKYQRKSTREGEKRKECQINKRIKREEENNEKKTNDEMNTRGTNENYNKNRKKSIQVKRNQACESASTSENEVKNNPRKKLKLDMGNTLESDTQDQDSGYMSTNHTTSQETTYTPTPTPTQRTNMTSMAQTQNEVKKEARQTNQERTKMKRTNKTQDMKEMKKEATPITTLTDHKRTKTAKETRKEIDNIAEGKNVQIQPKSQKACQKNYKDEVISTNRIKNHHADDSRMPLKHTQDSQESTQYYEAKFQVQK